MIAALALAWMLISGPFVEAQTSTAELLEKGIYTEETVGDLQSAIEIYRQIVERATKERTHAARALFRIGQCYEKIGESGKANSAFRRLVSEYAEQADLVARARARLSDEREKPRLRPVPWTDGEESHMVFSFPNGRPLGKIVSAIEKDRVGDRDVWRVQVRRMFTQDNRGVTNMVIDASTMEPITTDVWHTVLGNVSTRFDESSARLKREGVDEPQILPLTQPTYENDAVGLLFRRLPLDIGYSDVIRILPSFTGQQIDLGVEISQIDTISTPMGEFPSYRLDLSINQTAWISVDEKRYGTKAEVGGLVGRLTKVINRRRYEPAIHRNELAELRLPPDWIAFDRGATGDLESSITLQDPTAATHCGIQIKTVTESEDLTTRIQAVIDHNKETLGNYTVEDLEVVSNDTLSTGHYLGLFELSGKPMAHYRSFVLTPKAYVKLMFLVPSERYPDYRQTFDEIIRSFRLL